MVQIVYFRRESIPYSQPYTQHKTRKSHTNSSLSSSQIKKSQHTNPKANTNGVKDNQSEEKNFFFKFLSFSSPRSSKNYLSNLDEHMVRKYIVQTFVLSSCPLVSPFVQSTQSKPLPGIKFFLRQRFISFGNEHWFLINLNSSRKKILISNNCRNTTKN